MTCWYPAGTAGAAGAGPSGAGTMRGGGISGGGPPPPPPGAAPAMVGVGFLSVFGDDCAGGLMSIGLRDCGLLLL